ncbi:hypothetical protein O3597_26625 [Verrucosispora sp. WMMA2044]|uniref:hypothetical protein n=1 Tax=Verrucosispora sp. WMMA2044 TaxID=3016419 RepID=UPI00248D3563|nr:hypothetical protein [Verrucosispora sp. WMMA2044]WBB48611.1 hypothetical protein O3597_26625 [Verrucosispora sp. WMMA2044]
MLLLAVLLAAASGCTGAGTKPTRSGGDPVEARPDPGLLALGELLDARGALPVEQALRMVAGLVEPLPGVEPWTPADTTAPPMAGLALRTAAQALPTLDAPVADRIRAIVEPSADEEELVVRPGQGLARRGSTTVAPDTVPSNEELTGVVAGIVADIEERTGHRLRLTVRVRTVADARTGGDALTTPVAGDGGTTRACRIALPRTLFGADASSITSTIAHEVWHCFQYDAAPLRNLDGAPLWIIEGQAEWAGEAYVGGSPSSAARWDTWLLQPARALTTRSYDAIGLYAVAAATGADPWRTMLPMLGRRGARAVETLFDRSATEAVRRVATSLVRSPELGEVWESRGPGITGSRVAPVLTVAAEPVEARMRVPAFGALPIRINASGGEVLRVTVEGGAAGAVAMPLAGTVELAPGGHAMFCLTEEGCACPGARPGTPQAGAGEGAAAVGATTAGEVALVAELLTVEEMCESSGLVGEWVTDVANVMRVLSAEYGTVPSCRGPWVATFTADGRFNAGYEASCRIADVTGRATARFTGNYTDTGRTFTLSDVVGDGSMTLNGRTMPLPGVDGFRTALGNTADYVIDGDTLTYSFAAPDGSKPTIVLTRRS